MGLVEVLALLRPSHREVMTLDDLSHGFDIITQLLRHHTQWRPTATVSFLEGRANRLEDAQGNEPSFEAIRTKRFYFMWSMLFINITCGIALISVASPMAQEMAGMSAAAAAATMVGLMGLFNGLGRIGWASLSDYIGRPATYAAFFVIQIVAFFLLTKSPAPWQFQVLVLLILTCYGGGFASVPAFLGDLFGTKQLGAIHGYTLTAWAAAGLVGPTVVTRVQEATGNYATTLNIFAGLFVLALGITGLMTLDIRVKRADAKTTPSLGATNLSASAPG